MFSKRYYYQRHLLHYKVDVGLNALKRALTHYSYFNDKTHKKCNSNDIFLGMYAFKGYVADLLEQYVPGHGNDLQHILGQLLKKPQLEKLFDELGLKEMTRAGEDFSVTDNKHLFVYGYMGMLYRYLNKDDLDDWVIRYLFKNFEHLFFHKRKWDVVSQAVMIIRQNKGVKPKLEIGPGKEKEYVAKIMIRDQKLVEVESNSRKYIRKKAFKKAMIEIINEKKQAGVV